MKLLATGILMLLGLYGCAGTGLTPPRTASITPIQISLPHAEGKPEGKNEDYYDPNHTGVPLFDTREKKNSRLGPYFRVREFSHTGDVVFRYARIDGKLVACLSDLRVSIRKPISVQSAYRNWAYNTQLFKEGQRAAKKSFHMSGKAADIYVANVSAGEFARTLYSTCGCATGLGVGESWFHVDTRGYKVRPWGYGASSKLRLNSARQVQKQMCGGGGNDLNELSAALMESTKQVFDSLNKTLGDLFKE